MKTTAMALMIVMFAFGTQAAVRHRATSPNPLTADFVIGAFPRAGQPVQFTDASSGSPASWSWNFGDGATSTLRNPAHVYAIEGTFTVELCVTSARGTACARREVVLPLDLTGTWQGSTSKNAQITFVITQQGFEISGTGEYKQFGRTGKGPLTGTVAGRALTFTNEYPANNACTGVSRGVLTVTGGTMSGEYDSDDCGALEHGKLTLTRQ